MSPIRHFPCFYQPYYSRNRGMVPLTYRKKAVLTMKPHGQGTGEFMKLIQPFLSSMSHKAILDFLSIHTVVRYLYNFLGGSCGCGGVPFFHQRRANLHEVAQDEASSSLLEKTVISWMQNVSAHSGATPKICTKPLLVSNHASTSIRSLVTSVRNQPAAMTVGAAR
jgi:hypothetical protein